MEKNNELLDIIKIELDVFFEEGEPVELWQKKAFAESLLEILDMVGYKKKTDVEKETATAIYGSLYKTALLFTDKMMKISANEIKEIAKDVYGVEVQNGE